MKISTVNYLNSIPFVRGLRHSGLLPNLELRLDPPAVCADVWVKKEVDIGLVPVAALPLVPNHQIISDCCIGCDGAVHSVALLSEVPLEEIQEVVLDYQSRTSVNLVRVLAKHHWKIQHWTWTPATPGYENHISGTTAAVVIGDRAFDLYHTFPFVYDLGEGWKEFTGLPFVFAVWAANKPLDKAEESAFSAALNWGLEQRDEALNELEGTPKQKAFYNDYLTRYIRYELQAPQREAIKRFLGYLEEGV